MNEYILLGLASIVIAGIAAQWLAWRLHLSAVLLLVILGIIAGPVTGLLDPDQLFGDLLVPLVSLSVSLILFEGGLSLRLSELKTIASAVRRLISVGILISWLIITLAAYIIMGLDLKVAALLGAILVVTGPTVIVPLLRQVRPAGKVGSILRWEGILIDPIGAVLALLVFQGIFAVDMHAATVQAALNFSRALLLGSSVGLLGAGFMVLLLRNYLIPDFLQSSMALMTVVAVFTFSNLLQAESGLLAATVMGIALANQEMVSVKKIIEFKETLQVLIISGLFIVLTARLTIEDLYLVAWPGILFLLILIIIARPVAVMLSTAGTGLDFKEKALISFIAPRGIVAIAVSSVFALRLTKAGFAQAEYLVPLTFLVVIGTVVIYSIIAFPLARRLGLSQPHPQGLLIAGAHDWARAIACMLQEEGFHVLMVDSNTANIDAALSCGIPAYNGNILSEDIDEELDLNGIGRLLAITANDEVNSLATLSFADIFGGAEVYQLPLRSGEEVHKYLRGRFLFAKNANYSFLDEQFHGGANIKVVKINSDMEYTGFRKNYGDMAVPLFIRDENGKLSIIALDKPLSLRAGVELLLLGRDDI